LLLELRQIILVEFDERETQLMLDRINNAEIGYIDSVENEEKENESSDNSEAES
jgi:hypothetical protein